MSEPHPGREQPTVPRPSLHVAVDVIVFDVLGTLVDEPAGLRAGLRAVLPGPADEQLDELVGRWSTHVARAQEQIVAGRRAFVAGEALNREAAELVLRQVDAEEPAAVDTLVQAAWRLPAWPDSASGLARLAAHLPSIGLSNAGRRDLLRLNAHAGLRFHQALSAELARTYKPAPGVYRLAVEVAGVPVDRVLMVAAHAWDLRGARALGLRTAYVPRPVGDPPAAGERFDVHAESLDDLADQLGLPATSTPG